MPHKIKADLLEEDRTFLTNSSTFFMFTMHTDGVLTILFPSGGFIIIGTTQWL